MELVRKLQELIKDVQKYVEEQAKAHKKVRRSKWNSLLAFKRVGRLFFLPVKDVKILCCISALTIIHIGCIFFKSTGYLYMDAVYDTDAP